MKTYSTNQQIRLLAAYLPAFGIKHVVVCPGSRNAPIVHTLANTQGLVLHAVTDERSAGFVAIGIADGTGEKVAVCCTSGSALLNLAPAVAEAKYRNIPLLVISGDRPEKWIDQMDGQTIRQNDCFGSLAQTICLPEIDNDLWYTQRLINEAISTLSEDTSKPVHINIPLAEPLFDFSSEPLPKVKKIETLTTLGKQEIEIWQNAQRPILVVGQIPRNERLNSLLNELAASGKLVVIVEHLSNCHSINFVTQADAILQNPHLALAPDFVVYLGGHIVSKNLKLFLRKAKPTTCWHITQSEHFVDLFQCLTHRIITRPEDVLTQLAKCQTPSRKVFCHEWQKLNNQLICAVTNQWCEQNAVGITIEQLSSDSILSLANSSTVRYAQRYALKHNVLVQCNRGVNGIEGSLSAAVGIAIASEKPVTFITGDLSFFYDLNVLSICELPSNLTIVLLNNHRGKIFSNLPGLERSEHVAQYIAAQHYTNAKGWAADCAVDYMAVENCAALSAALATHREKTQLIECVFY